MKLICCWNSLDQIPGLDPRLYSDFVKPLSYEFDVAVGNEYVFFGLVSMGCTQWVYFFNQENLELGFAPAALFEMKEQVIARGFMLATAQEKGQLNILPSGLARWDNWFERYIDADKEVRKAVFVEQNRLLNFGTGKSHNENDDG